MSALTHNQVELLADMKRGVRVHFMGGPDGYFFRTDTMKRCSVTAQALEKRGLVERYKEDWKGYQLKAKQQKGDAS